VGFFIGVVVGEMMVEKQWGWRMGVAWDKKNHRVGTAMAARCCIMWDMKAMQQVCRLLFREGGFFVDRTHLCLFLVLY